MFKYGCLIILVIPLALLICCLLPTKDPVSIQATSDMVTSVNNDEIGPDQRPILKIGLSQKSILTPKLGMVEMAGEILKAGKFIATHPQDSGTGEVIFTDSLPVVDRYGNESQDEAMTLVFDNDDFRKVNWENFGSWDALNLASDVSFKSLGLKMAEAYCGDQDKASLANHFCNRVSIEANY